MPQFEGSAKKPLTLPGGRKKLVRPEPNQPDGLLRPCPLTGPPCGYISKCTSYQCGSLCVIRQLFWSHPAISTAGHFWNRTCADNVSPIQWHKMISPKSHIIQRTIRLPSAHFSKMKAASHAFQFAWFSQWQWQ